MELKISQALNKKVNTSVFKNVFNVIIASVCKILTI